MWNLSDSCELYDLEHDPHELTSLFYEPAHGPTRDRYFGMLADEAKRVDDAHVALLCPDIEGRSELRFDAALEAVEGIHAT